MSSRVSLNIYIDVCSVTSDATTYEALCERQDREVIFHTNNAVKSHAVGRIGSRNPRLQKKVKRKER